MILVAYSVAFAMRIARGRPREVRRDERRRGGSADRTERPAPPPAEKQGMSQGKKILYAVLGVWVGGIVLFVILFGFKAHKAPAVASGVFSPTNEFKLDTWFKLGPIAFNKGVLYLLITAGITIGVMTYIARRLQAAPRPPAGRGRDRSTTSPAACRGKTSTTAWKRKYFPLIATIFVFILVTQPDRLHPAAGRLRREVQAVRRRPFPLSRSTRPTRTSPFP